MIYLVKQNPIDCILLNSNRPTQPAWAPTRGLDVLQSNETDTISLFASYTK